MLFHFFTSLIVFAFVCLFCFCFFRVFSDRVSQCSSPSIQSVDHDELKVMKFTCLCLSDAEIKSVYHNQVARYEFLLCVFLLSVSVATDV